MSLYANVGTDRRQPIHSGERGTCPHCTSDMIGKCGLITVHHWAHQANATCDTWNEGETDWHLGWKLDFADAGADLETTMERSGQRHRADIVLPSGIVIEIQQRNLAPEIVKEREQFYRRMIWIIDGRNLDDRLHIGREVAYRARPPFGAGEQEVGIWFKNGSKRWLAFRHPVFIDTGDGQIVALRGLSSVGIDNERLLGIGWFMSRDTLISRCIAVPDTHQPVPMASAGELERPLSTRIPRCSRCHTPAVLNPCRACATPEEAANYPALPDGYQ